MPIGNIKKKTVSLVASAALIVSASALMPIPEKGKAFADPTASELRQQSKELKDELAEIQVSLEKASDDYNRVLTEKENADAAIEQAKEEIRKADEQIVDLQGRMAVRAKEMYIHSDASSTINMLLDARSFDEAMTALTYMDNMNRNDANMVDNAQRLKEEVELKKATAEEQALLAAEKAEEARIIKDEAQAKVDDYESRIADLDAEARRKALSESARAAAEISRANTSVTMSSGSDIPAHGDVVDYAYSRCGCPYVWAGSGPDVFDCSGLVMWCYAQTGISLPHSSESMYACAKAVIPVSEAQPGDVLYMSGHVGICIEPGGGTYIHAPTSGDVVRVASWGMFSCALRF